MAKLVEQAWTPRRVGTVLRTLEGLYPRHPLNVTARLPFQVLVATVLSSRTQDPTTNAAMERLWAKAQTPEGLLKLPEQKIAALIKPVGFYATKAKHLKKLSRLLLDQHAGHVPTTREELMALPGVGRKVANLVLNICFQEPAICVDTHVHRFSNRLAWVATETPEQTEYALMELAPQKHWAILNRVIVNHGQQVCKPISPICSQCVLARKCPKNGVTRSR